MAKSTAIKQLKPPQGTASLLLPHLVDELLEVSAMSAEQSSSEIAERLNRGRIGSMRSFATVKTSTKTLTVPQKLLVVVRQPRDTSIEGLFRD